MTNHAMSRILGVRLENAVGGRVIAGGVHGVGSGLVEGGGEADVAGGPARYCDFLVGHCGCCLSNLLSGDGEMDAVVLRSGKAPPSCVSRLYFCSGSK